MFRFIVSAACLAAAVPAFAQDNAAPAPQSSPAPQAAPQAPASPPAQAPAATGPQLAIERSAQAFAGCLQAGVQGLAATVTPEAGASTVMTGCATQKQSLQADAESFIGTLPEAQRAAAQENLRTHLAGIEAQVADAIRQLRAAQASPPAPQPGN